eukprot:gene12011-16079_t
MCITRIIYSFLAFLIVALNSKTVINTISYKSNIFQKFKTIHFHAALVGVVLSSFPINSNAVPSVDVLDANLVLSLDKTFNDNKGQFTFKYPSILEESSKPLKTHKEEVYLKSDKIKGYSVGVTIDPVKINSIKDFSTPAELGDKVVAVELSKEGVYEASIITANEVDIPISNIPAYFIEYKVDSSRGKNHYNVKSAIFNKNLYILTSQCKEGSYPNLEKITKEILDSFIINNNGNN